MWPVSTPFPRRFHAVSAPQAASISDDEIQNRMVARFLNEAAYCLQVRCDVHAMTPAVAACGDCVRGPRAVTACCNRVL